MGSLGEEASGAENPIREDLKAESSGVPLHHHPPTFGGLRGEGSRSPHSPVWCGGQGRFHGVHGVHWLGNSLKARSAGGRKQPAPVLT